jgi:hypothetical protein
MKTIFNFHPETQEFIGAGVADKSPLEPDVFLVPMFATDIEPPTPATHEVAVFEKKKWKLKPDWRGVSLYKMTDGSPISIDKIGVVPAEIEATDLPPDSALHSWIEGAWVLDQLKVDEQLRTAKTQALDTISGQVSGIRAAIAGTSDAFEVAGWPNKLRIALAILAGVETQADREAFQAEINRRGIEGETLEVFTAKVIRNSGAFSLIAADLDGLKRNAADAIAAVSSTEELRLVVDAHVLKINNTFNRS